LWIAGNIPNRIDLDWLKAATVSSAVIIREPTASMPARS
jgi:hypothetical protein